MGGSDRLVLPRAGPADGARTDGQPGLEMQHLPETMRGNREAMSDFLSTLAGTLAPAAFFAPENVERIMAAGRAAPRR